MIQPVQQDPSDLSLMILAGNISTPLTILKKEAVHVGAWTLAFHIIGESHYVTLAHEGQPRLVELLACVEINSETSLHQHQFDDMRDHCFEIAGYSVRVEFDRTHTPIPDSVPDSEQGLEVRFPEVAGHTPITRITWERVGDHAVRWATLHLYPHENELICVRSLSYFDSLHYNRTS